MQKLPFFAHVRMEHQIHLLSPVMIFLFEYEMYVRGAQCVAHPTNQPFYSRKMKANDNWNSVAESIDTFIASFSTAINQNTTRYKANNNLMT